VPATTTRGTQQTAEHLTKRRRRETEARVERPARAGAAAITQRLAELDESMEMLGINGERRYNGRPHSLTTRTRRGTPMRVTLQLVMCADGGQEATITALVTLQKAHRRIEHLGLTLAEAKQFLTAIQKHLLQHQMEAFLDARALSGLRRPTQSQRLPDPVVSDVVRGPSSSGARGSSRAAAGAARRPRCARCPRSSPGRLPDSNHEILYARLYSLI
jgi:hypothetical protein